MRRQWEVNIVTEQIFRPRLYNWGMFTDITYGLPDNKSSVLGQAMASKRRWPTVVIYE
jgi:hypothetical protein